VHSTNAASLFAHNQKVEPIFYDHLQWEEGKSIVEVIKLVHKMLEGPLRKPPPSDHDIKHHWHHENPYASPLRPIECQRAQLE
jgi:hypothetical protein